MNSVATDTCNTIRSLWEILHTKERFKRTFFILCDSHGLQLLIKDIVEDPMFNDTMSDANYITAYFRGANKQLALLRHYQQLEYGDTYELTLAVKTRWKTQYKVLRNVKRSMDALKRFARDRKNDCEDQRVLDKIRDVYF